MGNFELLAPVERERWLRELENLGEMKPDIHYIPEYCSLFGDSGEVRLFVYREGDVSVIYPFILRKVSRIPGLEGKLNRELFDITSPYGYGGPLASPGASRQDINNFYLQFVKFCEQNNIITEFIRFHPLLGNHVLLAGHVDVKRASSVICIDLNMSEQEIWNGYERNNRKNINKAKREGLEVIVEEGPEHFNDFIKIYQKTLARNQAGSFYYFNERFYESVHGKLKGHYLYAHTLRGGRVISTELLLYNDTYIHSFLGGTLEEFFEFRPNNILKHEVVKWAKKRGIRYFLLGGGYREGDGIFRYKRSFASGGVLSFYIGKKVHDHSAVSMLENEMGQGKQDPEGYFPSYRR
ncbi:MAG: GNAT family N-acetyltransferase [Eubacteriales bacterium]